MEGSDAVRMTAVDAEPSLKATPSMSAFHPVKHNDALAPAQSTVRAKQQPTVD